MKIERKVESGIVFFILFYSYCTYKVVGSSLRKNIHFLPVSDNDPESRHLLSDVSDEMILIHNDIG